jgi:hypothetical protein
MTDFRALSSRLLAALKTWSPAGGGPLEGAEEQYEAALIAEADAALAQPEPQGPTDKELLGYMLKAAASVPGGQCTGILNWDKEAIAAARAVIAADRARFGRPAIEPVPQQDDVHYAWELHDAEGEWQDGGSANSLDDVQRKGNRYLQIYSQYGPHKLTIKRHCVTTIEPVPVVEGADA